MYDPAAGAWQNIFSFLSGTPPSPRIYHGFTSVEGKIYVHGGRDSNAGERCAGQAESVGMVGAEAGKRDVLP